MMEKFARNKHLSLLQKFINYGHQKFYNIGPWQLPVLARIEGSILLRRKCN
jgi:hypothetical protein